ncbi:MAG: regulator protein [Acidimicrobiales bacterium]|nr:regulator protein [Acidimicrobiales bacterium]
MADLLDNAIWPTLTGPHRRFAIATERAARFHPDVSVFSALPEDVDPEAWAELAALHEPGETTAVFRRSVAPPPEWTVLATFVGIQMLATRVIGAPEPDALVLHAADVPEMLALAETTQPGPFRPRTIELGTYLGIRDEGRLVAMAGQRMRFDGHIEISAVCTLESHRRQGLGTRLVLDLVERIHATGAVAFLHASADNSGAIAMYERLGFEPRAEVAGIVLQVPTER